MAKKSKKSKALTRGSPKAVPPKAVAPMAALVPVKRGKLATLLAPEASIPVRIVIELSDGTPTYYSNFLEVSRTKWDFSLLAARVPAKHDAAKIAEMKATGALVLPADVVISIPANLVPGLIRALTSQKEQYEKDNGVELKEMNDEQTTHKKRKQRNRRR